MDFRDSLRLFAHRKAFMQIKPKFFFHSQRDLMYILAVSYINDEVGEYATSNNLNALRAPACAVHSMYLSLNYLEQLGYLTQPRKRVRRVNRNGNVVISGWWCLTALGRRVCEEYAEIYEKCLVQVENELKSDTIMLPRRTMWNGKKVGIKKM